MQLLGTEVPSLSWDKGTAGQAQNLATGQNGMRSDETGQDRTRQEKRGRGRGQSLLFAS